MNLWKSLDLSAPYNYDIIVLALGDNHAFALDNKGYVWTRSFGDPKARGCYIPKDRQETLELILKMITFAIPFDRDKYRLCYIKNKASNKLYPAIEWESLNNKDYWKSYLIFYKDRIITVTDYSNKLEKSTDELIDNYYQMKFSHSERLNKQYRYKTVYHYLSKQYRYTLSHYVDKFNEQELQMFNNITDYVSGSYVLTDI